MNPTSLPTQSSLMQAHEVSPAPVSPFNNPTMMHAIATLMGQAQAPTPVPPPPQLPATPGTFSAADVLNLVASLGLQQNGSTAGSSAGLTSNPPNALVQGPPVGAYPNDEDILIEALRESEEKGWTYRKALEGLHGQNYHLASQWKDYYLDNVQRLNHRVSLLRNSDRPVVVAKKPSFDPPRESASSRAVPKASSREQTASKRTSEAKAARASASDKRNVASVDSLRRLSRSPTPPPPSDEFSAGRFRFSEADKVYLVRYARYRIAKNPHVHRSDICAGLATKAPHHSANSWTSHWHTNREGYDEKIYGETRHEDAADGVVASNEDYRVGRELEESGSEYNDESDTDSESDRQNMGPAGSSVTNADKRVLARYIASFGREWGAMKYKERWDPFEAMYPQRAAKSWAEVYRRFEKAVDTLAKKYRKRRLSEVKSQTGRPTWASNSSHSPSSKRVRHDEDEDEDEDENYNPSKRAKELL